MMRTEINILKRQLRLVYKMIKTVAINAVYLALLKLLTHLGEDTWNLNTILGCVFMVYNGLAHLLYRPHATTFVRFSNTVYLNTILFMFMSQTISDSSAEMLIKKTYMWVNIVLCIYTSIVTAFIGIEDYLNHTHNQMYVEVVDAIINTLSGYRGTRKMHIKFLGLELYSNGVNIITEDDLHEAAPTFDNTSDERCPICMDVLTGLSRKLHCEHIFHATCIDTWILKASHDTCPLCRISILT